MKTITALRTGACLTALIAAPAAWADVTAQQVWDAWQDSMSGYASGASVTTGSVAEADGTLTVTDFALTSDADGTAITVTMPQITFAEVGDGTVEVTLPDMVPVTITSDDGTDIDMSVTATDAAIIASGTPEALSYDLSANQYLLRIDSLTSPGGPVTGDMRMTLNNLTAATTVTTDALRETTYDATATGVDLLFDVTAPDGTDVMVSGKIDGIASSGTTSAPVDLDYSDPAAVFGGEYVAEGGYTSGASAYILSVGGPSAVDGTATSGPASMTFAVGAEGMTYDVQAEDVSADLTSAEMPFPLRLSAESYGFGLTTPVAPTDAPVPFGLQLDLSGLTVNDEIWAMFDPTSSLPRDPATLRLDLSGAAQLDVAIMDPDQAATMAEQTGFPGTLDSLTLNELTLDAVGLSVDGTGDFTFDNSDTTTFPGMPLPTGQATINVTGLNALLDNLIAMGLIPADQAMMPRMMLGMFAKPVGDDAVQSVIEVRDGQVLANGQRIR